MTRGLGSVRWFCCLMSSLLSPRPISPPPPALPPILPPSLPDSVPQSLLLTSLHPSLRPFPTLSVMQGCKNRASFGSHRAEWCSLHRAPHDTNKRLASCTFAGCLKQASFQNTYICMRMHVLHVSVYVCLHVHLHACIYVRKSSRNLYSKLQIAAIIRHNNSLSWSPRSKFPEANLFFENRLTKFVNLLKAI